MKRRTYLKMATTVAVGAALAGCASDPEFEEGNPEGNGGNGGGGGGGSSGSNTPEPAANPTREPETEQAPAGTPEPTATPVKDELVVLSHELVREDEGTAYETVAVVGQARNNTDRNLGYAEIRVKFYDESGALLDSSLDNINDLGPGETWNFEATMFAFGEDAAAVASYQIAVGTNF